MYANTITTVRYKITQGRLVERSADGSKFWMMKQIELELEKRCRAQARRYGWVCCKLEKNGCKGIPDDLFISPDERFVLVEFKKDEKQKPRPEQAIWLRRFSKSAHLIGSYSEFCKVLGIAEN